MAYWPSRNSKSTVSTGSSMGGLDNWQTMLPLGCPPQEAFLMLAISVENLAVVS